VKLVNCKDLWIEGLVKLSHVSFQLPDVYRSMALNKKRESKLLGLLGCLLKLMFQT